MDIKYKNHKCQFFLQGIWGGGDFMSESVMTNEDSVVIRFNFNHHTHAITSHVRMIARTACLFWDLIISILIRKVSWKLKLFFLINIFLLTFISSVLYTKIGPLVSRGCGNCFTPSLSYRLESSSWRPHLNREDYYEIRSPYYAFSLTLLLILSVWTGRHDTKFKNWISSGRRHVWYCSFYKNNLVFISLFQ